MKYRLEGRTPRKWFCLSLVIIACTSCSGKMLGSDNRENANGTPKSEAQYELDIHTRSVVRTIGPKDRVVEEGYKFVQVEVTKVVNPEKYAIAFEVDYREKPDVTTHLGSFSLYPSDNPGKFIVPTQGKLKNEGGIVLTMVLPNDPNPSDTLRVTVKRLQFLKE